MASLEEGVRGAPRQRNGLPIASVSVAQRQQQSEWAENRNGGDVERPHDRRELLITLPLSLYRIPVDNRTAIPYTL